MLKKVGQGAYAEVFKCQNHFDQSIWACKRLFKSFKRFSISYILLNSSADFLN